MTTSRTATYDVRVDLDQAQFGAFEVIQVTADSPAEAYVSALACYPEAQRVTVLCARFAPDATYLGGIAFVS
jgi:hypothetical protein